MRVATVSTRATTTTLPQSARALSLPVLVVFLVQRPIPLRARTGTASPSPVVPPGPDAVIWGRAAINGEFLCSVKAVTAITTTIAVSAAMMATLPRSPSRPLRLVIGSAAAPPQHDNDDHPRQMAIAAPPGAPLLGSGELIEKDVLLSRSIRTGIKPVTELVPIHVAAALYPISHLTGL